MKKRILILSMLMLGAGSGSAQTDSIKGTFWKPVPRIYEAEQAIEVESLFPMFFTM